MNIIKKKNKVFDINIIEIHKWNDLFKSVYNNYILNNENILTKDEIINISLKYEILNKYKSLFSNI